MTTRYNGSTAAWDVVNEALCDCTYDGASWDTCEGFFEARPVNAAAKCGYESRYGVYLKRNVYWPDIPNYIEIALNTTRMYDPNTLLGYVKRASSDCSSHQQLRRVTPDELSLLPCFLSPLPFSLPFVCLQLQ